MSNYNPTQNAADAQKKIVYTFVQDTINVQPGWVMQFTRFGTKDYKWAPGGKSINFLINSGAGGSPGTQSTTGSLAHLGKQPGVRQQVNLASCVMFVRATCSQNDILDWQRGGMDANYINVPMENIQNGARAFPRLLESILSNDSGDGRVGSVTTTTAAIAAGTTGNITVDNMQYFQRGAVLSVSRSSSIISDVELVVQVSNGIGPGTVSVYNQGGTSYTPTDDDIMYVEYALDTLQLTSLNECVGIAAYPPRGSNTSPITNADYRAILLDGNNQLVNIETFRGAWRNLKERGFTEDTLGVMEDPQSGLRSFVKVALMTMGQSDALSQELWGQTKLTTPRQADPGWGWISQIDGYPVVENNMQDQTSFYILDPSGFICTLGEPTPMVQGGEMGVYTSIPETTNFEARFSVPVAFGVMGRNQQLRVRNVRGQSNTTANLTLVTS